MSGIETIIIGGGAQWLVGKLADKVSDEAVPAIEEHLNLENGFNIRKARKEAEAHGDGSEFNEVLAEFEMRTGESVDDLPPAFMAEAE